MGNRQTSMRAIALGGVFLALSMVTLFLATITPGIELTLYTLSSFFVAFVVIETDIKGGWVFYFASVLLSAILIPNKAAILPYAMFFGLYPVVKYYIEGKRTPYKWLELLIKLAFFNFIFGVGVFFIGHLFLGAINLPKIALPLLIIAAQGGFLFYDYLFTIVVGFFMRKRQRL